MMAQRPLFPIGIILLAIWLLSGCSRPHVMHSSYPTLDVPTQWSRQTISGRVTANDDRWWTCFNDSQLTALIDKALRTNNDLAFAALKVRKAKLEAGLVNTNRVPDVQLLGEVSAAKDLAHSSTSTRNQSVSLTLNYEVDLWGKLAQSRNAAEWKARATEHDRRSTALTLIGTTAQLYWQIAALNHKIALEQENMAAMQKIVALVTIQHQAGKISGLDKAQIEQQLAMQYTRLTNQHYARDKARHALAILFNQPPQQREVERTQLPSFSLLPPSLGVPADILSQRPDVQAAEWRVRKNLAEEYAEKASFYPTLSIASSLSSDGAAATQVTLADLLKAPIGTLSATLILPIVQWNTAQLKIKVSHIEYEQSVVHFRKTFYQALADVENALSAHTQYQEENKYQQDAYQQAVKATHLAQIRYQAGKTSLREWLDQQKNQYQAAIALEENRYNQFTTLMTLYLALGGYHTSFG